MQLPLSLICDFCSAAVLISVQPVIVASVCFTSIAVVPVTVLSVIVSFCLFPVFTELETYIPTSLETIVELLIVISAGDELPFM